VTPADIDRLVVRRAEGRDGPGLGDVWLSAWYATFDFPPSHPDDEVRRWLATEMAPSKETWVAVDPSANERVVALLALSDSMVDQLYVAPDWIGHGLGGRLLDLAKSRRPDGLELYCFAANGYARRFYESHGFEAVAFGDGSGNEERQPDVRYRWRPAGRRTRDAAPPPGR
jgi:GNAT superfamily N-acetyltransferase